MIVDVPDHDRTADERLPLDAPDAGHPDGPAAPGSTPGTSAHGDAAHETPPDATTSEHATPGPAGPEGVALEDAGRPTPRALLLSIGSLVTAVLFAVLVITPAPYAVNTPGPTRDVLGEVDGEPLVRVSGAETYPSSGELRLTTISGSGGPGYPAYLLDVLGGWVSRHSVVRPVEQVYPEDVTREELDESNAGAMVSSQENATVAALTELGYEVPATLVVAGTVEGSDAEGRLEEGDVVTAMDGEALPDYQTLVSRLDDVEPGSTVTLTVTRHGATVEVPVVTREREGGGAQIGVYVDPSFDMPVDVDITVEGIGGPSAGMMFALGIVDLLTPEDEADGEIVAGTGTIDVTGEVGTIGGIRQKLAGAARDGARWFLAPEGNCDEVVGYEPDGLRVVPVGTLSDARAALVAIGAGEGDDLPTCPAS